MSEFENMNPENEPGEEPKTPFETFIYHQRRALEETGKALEALLPEGFREHGGEASREFVKGFKALVDAAITEIEKATSRAEEVLDNDDDNPPSTTGKTKVKVQVE
jgi:hypothetical protein